MARKTKRWLLWVGGALLLLIAVITAVGFYLAWRFEPFIREETIAYFEKRFDARMRLDALKVNVSWRGKDSIAHIDARGIELHLNALPDLPPVLAMHRLRFDVRLNELRQRKVVIREVRLEGLQVSAPPKGSKMTPTPAPAPASESTGPKVDVSIGAIVADGSRLTILPRKEGKAPLVFEMHKLRLEPGASGGAMRYETELTNAKPPGLIKCSGTFGPWNTESPSESPLTGTYVFENANLGVFKGIAGTLSSRGSFEGVLNEIIVDGTTQTPDFRLTMSGNRVPLSTEFHAIVDGTNGDTRLQPVNAVLGQTRMTVRGAVERYEGEKGKTVALNAEIPAGRLDDVLLLAMKGSKPFMRGGITLKTRIIVPPGKAEIADKLQLFGSFRLSDAHFTSPAVQDGLDSLSRRAQGQPSNDAIDEVQAVMSGAFEMLAGRIHFSALGFSIPGADVSLQGQFEFDSQELDFFGEARIRARLSEMMVTRWKRWALKPVDPFFAKEGYGTLAKIRIAGTREKPEFGLAK